MPYGSICFSKQQAFNIGGYDEQFVAWGGDDDDFRNRLSLAGYYKKPTFSKFIHVQFNNRAMNCSDGKSKETRDSLLKKIEKIYSTTDYKVASSLLSKETVQCVFEFRPH